MPNNHDTDGERKPPKALEPSGELVDPTPGRIYLRHAQDIRRELASVYRDMRVKKIDPQDGTRLAYVLDLIRKAYETSVLQERIEILERVLKLRNRNNEV
ncbi:MAG: hypothetical protein ACYDBH_19460 [Acidobacteriaceae bacterium]